MTRTALKLRSRATGIALQTQKGRALVEFLVQTKQQQLVETGLSRVSLGRLKARLSTKLAGTVACQLGILLLGVLTGLIAARLLGPQGRGELAAITLWPATFVFLTSFGLNQSIVFYTGKNGESISEVWTASTVIGIMQAFAAILLSLPALHFLLKSHSADVRHLTVILALASPLVIGAGYPGNIFQGRNDLHRFNLIRLIGPSVYAIGLVLLAILKRPHLREVVFWVIMANLLALVVGQVLVFRQFKPSFVWRSTVSKSLLRFGFKAHLSNLSGYLNQRVDQLILSVLVPASELGLYAVAVTLAMAISFFPVAAGTAAFAKGANQNSEDARRTITRAFRVSLVWLFAGCAALFFMAPLLIRLAFGDKFAGSTMACRLLLPGMLALGLNQILYSGANALGRPSLPSYAEGVGLVVTGVGLYFCVPRWGYLGAAVVSSFAYFTSFGVMLVLSRIRLGLRYGQLFSLPFRNDYMGKAKVESAESPINVI